MKLPLWKRALIVAAVLATALLVRLALHPYLGHRLPFGTLYLADAVIAWFCGVRVALLTNLFGVWAAGTLFADIRFTFPPEEPWILPGIAFQILNSAGIVALVHYAKHMQHRAEARSAELSSANERLTRADEEKNAAIARVAHEIRNPLQAIVYCTSSLRRLVTEPRADRPIALIEREAANARSLTSDLLDVTAPNAGERPLAASQQLVAPLVAQAVDQLRAEAQQKGVQIHEEHRGDGKAELDPLRIHQVLANVIANAIRYSHPGGEVRIVTEADARSVTITVRDHGIGIEPEWLDRIGKPFVRAPGAARRSRTGVGIGLALSRRLVEQHGGALTIESDGIDRGSMVTIALPLTPRRAVVESEVGRITRAAGAGAATAAR